MNERIEAFTSSDLRDLEDWVNGWIERHPGIEIMDRKFAMSSVSDNDYPNQQIAQFGYCIVYRQKE